MFSQGISFQLGKLVHMSQLDLSYNSLEGEIPSEISKMESLEKLNLSHNNLSGFIPKSFEDMNWLSYVDISYNDLEGPLPNSSAVRDASPEALQGNKGFCGSFELCNPAKISPKRTTKDSYFLSCSHF